MAKFFFFVVSYSDVFFVHAKAKKPIFAEVFPEFKPLGIRARFAEKFKFHLLEFSCSEGEVSWSDFIPERFANLSNSERNFLPHASLNIAEINENSLSGFRAQENFGFFIFRNSLEGFEHKVEFSNSREVFGLAIRARNFFFFDKLFHLLGGHPVRVKARIFD